MFYKDLERFIDEKKQCWTKASDQIWNYAETKFQETRSSETLCSLLAQEGVEVVRNIRDNNWAARDFTDIAKQNDPPAFKGILIDKNNKKYNS